MITCIKHEWLKDYEVVEADKTIIFIIHLNIIFVYKTNEYALEY